MLDCLFSSQHWAAVLRFLANAVKLIPKQIVLVVQLDKTDWLMVVRIRVQVVLRSIHVRSGLISRLCRTGNSILLRFLGLVGLQMDNVDAEHVRHLNQNSKDWVYQPPLV